MGDFDHVFRKDLLESAFKHASEAEVAAEEVDMYLSNFGSVAPDNEDVSSFDGAVAVIARRGLMHAATSQAYSTLAAALRPGDLPMEEQ